MIRADDRVSKVLAHDESLIDVFIALSPAFERLRNPALRRVMTKLVTVQQAARMGGVDPDVLLARLNQHAAHAATSPTGEESVSSELPVYGEHTQRPASLDRIPADAVITADVREELRAGREPFSIIMAARRAMPDGGALCVRAIFEPVPLYAVMQRQGLGHWTERVADDDWIVWFYEEGDTAPASPDAGSVVADAPPLEENVVVLDVRGLEPPEPMQRTLAALEQLPAGAVLVQLNVRVPQFLLPLLDERGFTYEIREQDSQLVRTFIRRKTN